MDLVHRCIPSSRDNVTILATSRSQFTAQIITTSVLEILPFSNEESSLFLCRALRTTGNLEAGDNEAVQAIVNLMAGLPLAILRASEVIYQRRWNAQNFLRMYKRYPKKLLDFGWKGQWSHRRGGSLTQLWRVEFEGMERSSATLLGVLSYLDDPDTITEDLISWDLVSKLPPDLKFVENEWDLEDTISHLIDRSLIRHKPGDSFSIHRLVQAEFRSTMIEESRRQCSKIATTLLQLTVAPDENVPPREEWAKCKLHMSEIIRLAFNNIRDVEDVVEPKKL
ncbi:hypothetical protein VTL71DRAFT_5846 [Oculimacula yallundae]|uniref:DUF7779 domain-containing protein n=1 Tax=Oculimacula yallundae TaxID=86028 RepID=A0ABR4BYM9_9HELO